MGNQYTSKQNHSFLSAKHIYYKKNIEINLGFSKISKFNKALINDNKLKEIADSNHIETINNSYSTISINLYDFISTLNNLFAKYNDDDYDINAALKEININIEKIKNAIENANRQYNNLNVIKCDIKLENTQEVLNQAKQELEALNIEIKKSDDIARNMLNNENKQFVVKLLSAAFGASHSFLIPSLVKYLREISIITRFIFTPQGMVVCLIVVTCYIIYYFATEKNKDSEVKNKLFHLYVILNKILQSVRKKYQLASIINLSSHIGGNLLIGNHNFQYLPSMLAHKNSFLNKITPMPIEPLPIYSFNSNGIEINKLYEDVSNSNVMDKKPNGYALQFSIVPNYGDKIISDDDIFSHSAFKHLKNMTLGFSDFLFVLTPHFTSTLTLDILLQSFRESVNRNKPLSKSMLFITQPLNTDSIYFGMQNFIRNKIIDNEATKENALFLSLISKVDKSNFFDSFEKVVTDNYKIIESDYNKKCNYLERWWHTNQSNNIKKFCEALKTSKSLNKVLQEFGRLVDIIFSQKHLFEFIETSDKDKVANIKLIIEAFPDCEMILSNFIDFKNNIAKNDKMDEDTLNTLKRKVREQLDKNKSYVSVSAFCIANIFNNAYFSNNPSEELKDLKNLIGNIKKNEGYQYYKDKLINNNYISDNLIYKVVDLFMPLSTDMIIVFLQQNEYKELCIFILYLIDLETQGYFILSTTNLTLPKIKKILQTNLNDIAKQDSEERLNELLFNIITDSVADKLTGEVTVRMPNVAEFVGFLVSICVKDYAKKLKDIVDNPSSKSQRFVEFLKDNILNANNQKNLQEVINNSLSINIQKNQHDLQIIITNKKSEITFKYADKPDNKASKLMRIIFFLYMSQQKLVSIKDSLQEFATFAYAELLNKIFPIVFKENLKRDIMLLVLNIRDKQDSMYSKWNDDKEYFYIPKAFTHSLLVADFKASLVIDNALDIGYCINSPSIGIMAENTELAKKHIIDFLRRNIKAVSLNKFHTQSDSIFKEAYCKVLHYIGSAQGEHTEFLAKRIPSIATKIKEFFNPEALFDTENLIRTKIKKASNLGNDDENFKTSKAMKYSRDFLIQLKRVAEYNYLVYSGEFKEETKESGNGLYLNESADKKETDLLGNLIYDKGFIPTTIDVKD